MKRTISMFALTAASLVFGGCSIPSLNSLASDEVVVADEGFAGTWIPQEKDGTPNNDEKYVIKDEGDKNYTVTVVKTDDKGKKPAEFGLQLVKLGDHQFVDMTTPKSAHNDLERFGTTLAPMHNIFKAKREGDTLTIWPLNNDAFDKGLKDGSIKLQFARYGEDQDAVITATTKDLQEFFKQNAETAKLYEEPGMLKREKAK